MSHRILGTSSGTAGLILTLSLHLAAISILIHVEVKVQQTATSACALKVGVCMTSSLANEFETFKSRREL